MKSPGKRHLTMLGLASALATAGLVWLGFKMAGRSAQLSLAAIASPLAVWCLVLIGVGVAVLALLAAILIRLRPAAAGRPQALHADQGGTAAIEMAFVFPIGLMIFLVVTQAALLFNANMVVHYATFAAARMAIVVVPMNIGSEPDKLVWPCNAESQGPSEKIEMMRRAAVLALVPISAELKGDASQGGLSGGEREVSDAAQAIFKYAAGKDQWWFHRIQNQYRYANAFTKIILAPPDHWQDGNPDNDCPNAAHRRDEWTMWGWSYVPYCPYSHRTPPIWDFWWYEVLDVKIKYQFLLEVPYASRFMGKEIAVPGRSGKSYAAEIKWALGLTCEGGPEIRPQS